MASLRRHLTYANVMATIAVFFALAGGTFAAVKGIPGPDGKISACFKKKDGTLRVVKAGAKCRKGESALDWNQKGQVGARGERGEKGSDAGIHGVGAGGALSGTYPNPSLANGSVGTSKIGAIPTVRLGSTVAPVIPANVETGISFDTELYDVGDMHDPSSPQQIVIQTAGVYLVTTTIDWNSSGTDGIRVAYITRNGGSILARTTQNATSSGDTEQQATTTSYLNPGDILRTVVRHTSTNDPLNINAFSNETPTMSATWIAPGA